MNLDALVRPNIRELKPYASARSEFSGQAEIFLDANENPFETGLNRYPDPLQKELKARISQLKGVPGDQIFLGNGSDEVIDLLIRIFCEPKEDHILILPPTYGMYKVSADIANVGIREVPLTQSYQLQVDKIVEKGGPHSKLLFICHPNNPTGNNMRMEDIEAILKTFPGIVVVDEAYIDFSSLVSCTQYLSQYPNLVVMQTFSKAWGLAGIRLGMAFASPEIIAYFNKVKPPYNINILTQETALKALENEGQKSNWVKDLLDQRAYLNQELSQLKLIKTVKPTDTNFILVEVDDPKAIYTYLINQKVIVRDRSKVLNCEGCLRITVGAPEENKRLIEALKGFGQLKVRFYSYKNLVFSNKIKHLILFEKNNTFKVIKLILCLFLQSLSNRF